MPYTLREFLQLPGPVALGFLAGEFRPNLREGAPLGQDVKREREHPARTRDHRDLVSIVAPVVEAGNELP